MPSFVYVKKRKESFGPDEYSYIVHRIDAADIDKYLSAEGYEPSNRQEWLLTQSDEVKAVADERFPDEVPEEAEKPAEEAVEAQAEGQQEA